MTQVYPQMSTKNTEENADVYNCSLKVTSEGTMFLNHMLAERVMAMALFYFANYEFNQSLLQGGYLIR